MNGNGAEEENPTETVQPVSLVVADAATRDKSGYTIQTYAYYFTRGVMCDIEKNNIR